jgi:hypothetical protein
MANVAVVIVGLLLHCLVQRTIAFTPPHRGECRFYLDTADTDEVREFLDWSCHIMVVPRMVRPLLKAINQRDDVYYSKKQFGLSTTMRNLTNSFFDYASFDMLSRPT